MLFHAPACGDWAFRNHLLKRHSFLRRVILSTLTKNQLAVNVYFLRFLFGSIFLYVHFCYHARCFWLLLSVVYLEIKYYFQVSFLLLKFAGAMWCIYIWILGFFVLNANRIPFIFWLCSQWADWLLWELRIFWFYYYFQSIEMGMFFHFLFPWAIKY